MKSITSTKKYSFTAVNNKYYLYSYSLNQNVATELRFYPFDASNPINSVEYINHVSFENIQNIIKCIKKIAPVDVRIYIDHLEIMDLEEKNTILNTIVPIECRTDTTTSIRQLNSNGLRIVKKEITLKQQLKELLSQVDSLSLRDCEKFVTALRK